MGFPLDKGSVEEGILSCHWHHARFDLASGGAFDLWADDIDSFPVDVRAGEIFVDLSGNGNTIDHQRVRLRDGLQHNLSLVVAKAVINMLGQGVAPVEPFRIGLDFGTFYRGMDWGRGLTTLGCAINLVPYLDETDRPLALFHGLADVASDTAGMSPRFNPRPLPNDETDIPTLKAWFRQFVEVRDAQAGERAIVSALRAGADDVQIADMLFSAATDHRYLDAGHTLDFINKALTSVDLAGWEHAELAFTSVVPNLTEARRMEESNAWRKPIDLIPMLETAFAELPEALKTGSEGDGCADVDAMLPILLGDEPAAIIDLLLNCLREGITPLDLAGVVAYTAARRIAHFHTSNEFGDWDTALHTFTFANAVHQGLGRVESIDLTRGIFDAAMSIYLDRFLNLPLVRLPSPEPVDQPDALLDEFESLLNLQQQVNQAWRPGGAVSRERRLATKVDGEDGAFAAARRPRLPHDSMYRSVLQSVQRHPSRIGRAGQSRADRGGALPGGPRPDHALAAANLHHRAAFVAWGELVRGIAAIDCRRCRYRAIPRAIRGNSDNGGRRFCRPSPLELRRNSVHSYVCNC